MMDLYLALTLPSGEQITQTFLSLLGSHRLSIIYFYPKDDTPGCTIEAKDFAEYAQKFLDHNIAIYGVSKDSHRSHCRFIKKYNLPFPLIIDPEFVFHEKFKTVGEKTMYGKKYRGTIRSTFLFDSQGNIIKERRNVIPTGHVKEVYDFATQI